MNIFGINTTNQNACIATLQLLSLLDININRTFLSKILTNCKDFPSLASINETLDVMKIKNMSVAITKENLEEIPLPAIAHLSIDDGLFAPIRKVEDNIIEWYHQGKGWQKESLQDFSEKWTGVALLVDSDTIGHAKRKYNKSKTFLQRNTVTILALSFVFATLIYNGIFNFIIHLNLVAFTSIIFNLVGLAFCFLATSWNFIEAKVPFIRQEKILSTMFIRQIHFNLEEVSILYFLTNMILICITIDKNILGLDILLLAGSLFMIISIWFLNHITNFNRKYKFLVTILVLINICVFYLQISVDFFSFSLDSIIYIGSAISISYLIKTIFLKITISEKTEQQLEILLQNVKRNKSYASDFLKNPCLAPPIFQGMNVIEIGNKEATHTITIFGDPTDENFKLSYYEALDTITKNEAFKLQVILMGLNHYFEEVNVFIKRLLSSPIENQQKTLEAFFNNSERNISKWLKSNYSDIKISNSAEKSFDLYKKWLEVSEFQSVPIVLLNGVELPIIYQVSDIEYIVENMDLKKNESTSYEALKVLKQTSIQTLKKNDSHLIPDDCKEIRLFAIMRNESLRLPYFLDYYKNLKVDRFFLIDNNSTDNSKEIALNRDNVHLFSTEDLYQNHWFWMEHLLDTYGKNHWCVVVDIDELFSYPHSEELSLKDLVNFLEKEKSSFVRSLLLDMYSDKTIGSTKYQQGTNPLINIPYFDKEYSNATFMFEDRLNFKRFSTIIYTGGMRTRVFGEISPPHILSKIPLFFNSEDTYLVQGMHAINNSKSSSIQGVVFHTKFLSDFIKEVKDETVRGQHYGGAFYYKHYEKELNKNFELSLICDGSVKYINSEQLVALDIMKTNDLFEEFVDSRELTCV